MEIPGQPETVRGPHHPFIKPSNSQELYKQTGEQSDSPSFSKSNQKFKDISDVNMVDTRSLDSSLGPDIKDFLNKKSIPAI